MSEQTREDLILEAARFIDANADPTESELAEMDRLVDFHIAQRDASTTPDLRMFPIQVSREKDVRPYPFQIPWNVAEMAYCVYASRYGIDQSLERLAQRGGFHPGEMDEFYPNWREETSEMNKLRAENARLTRSLATAREALERIAQDGGVDANQRIAQQALADSE